MEIAYKGTHFHGWQIQENAHSIQGVLQGAMGTLLRRELDLTGCGRTDSGVHALQHFSHFDAEEDVFNEPFIHQLNSLIPDDMVVKSIFKMHEGAHARFDAIWRTYNYRLYFKKNPFLKGLSSFCSYYPDVERMQKGSEVLKEYQDFSCFSKSNTQVKTNICKLNRLEWVWEGEELVFQIEADRFLRNMVRAIVGTLLRLGWGEISMEDLRKIVESGDRGKAGASVSPDGLYLQHIQYPYPLPEPKPYMRTKSRNSSL